MSNVERDQISGYDAEPEPPRGWTIDRVGLVLGPLALLTWLLTPQGSLTPEAHRLAGIMLFTIIWWVTEPIPIAATGLAAVVLCVFLQAVPAEDGRLEAARTVLAPFADPSVFFLLGGVYIGRAMTRHGLDRRLALSILCTRWAGRSPATVLAAEGLAVALTSMWISNTAATAMMYPVALGIIAVLAGGSGSSVQGFARSPYATGLLLMTAYASSVGGIATPIGTATNVVAMGYFKRPEYFGHSADFLRWSLVGVPMMFVLFIGLFVWLQRRSSSAGLAMDQLRQYLRDEYAGLGKWKRGEINTLVVFLIVVSLWIAPGVLSLFSMETGQAFSKRFPEEITALLAPVLLFLLPVDWAKRQFTLEGSDLARIDWGTILLFGAGLSLGGLMFKTGLAQAVGEEMFELFATNNVWVITALSIVCGIVLSEFTSNAATASTLIPVIYQLARQAGVDPVPPLMGVTFGASFGSALPVSTPPNAIVYSSGLIPVRRMVAAGAGLDVICAIVIWISLCAAFSIGWSPF
jgi:sodium-dependent dicarboxylate transporter 2/3/5